MNYEKMEKITYSGSLPFPDAGTGDRFSLK